MTQFCRAIGKSRQAVYIRAAKDGQTGLGGTLAAIHTHLGRLPMMSYVDPEGVPPPVGAARVGAELRYARERLGWTAADVAGSVRIRQPYLEAIEEGRLSDLPGNAYAMGFVRTYARSLGLDPDEVTRRFRAEAQEVNRKTELQFPAPVPQRGVPAGAVVLVGLLIAAGAYVGWYRYSGSDESRPAQISAPPPERLAALAPVPAPSPQVASILPASPAPAPAPAPAFGATAPLPAVSSPALPVPTPVPVTSAPPPPPPAAPSSRLVLHAKSGGWVQIREKQGQVLLNRVMRPGENWPVPMKPQLLLTTSNAGAMELLVDGVVAPALGPAGTMRRDVSLDIEAVKAGDAAKPAKPASTTAPAPQ